MMARNYDNPKKTPDGDLIVGKTYRSKDKSKKRTITALSYDDWRNNFWVTYKKESGIEDCCFDEAFRRWAGLPGFWVAYRKNHPEARL